MAVMKDRYMSWTESQRLAGEMRKATLDRLLKPKTPKPPDPDKPQIGGIPYTPPPKDQ